MLDALAAARQGARELSHDHRRRPRCARRSRTGSRAATDWPALDAATQVLPVLGSREALFAFAQTVVDANRTGARSSSCPIRSTRSTKAPRCSPARRPYCVTPSRGTRLRTALARRAGGGVGAHAAALRLLARQPDRARDDPGRVAERCSSSPTATASSSPPTSATPRSTSTRPGRRSARSPPRRRSDATATRGWSSFGSLSKRSNAPGLRSGYVAGDAALRQGVPALPHLPRLGDVAGGRGGQPRRLERRGARARQPPPLRRRSSRSCSRGSPRCCPARCPTPRSTSGRRTPIDDAEFARRLSPRSNVTVLPGSYLARNVDGANPGAGYVRIALVADPRRVRRGDRAHRRLRAGRALTAPRPRRAGRALRRHRRAPSRAVGATGDRGLQSGRHDARRIRLPPPRRRTVAAALRRRACARRG